MSRRHRLAPVAIGLIALCFGLSLFALVLDYSATNSHHYNDATQTRTQYPDDQIVSCTPSDDPNVFLCVQLSAQGEAEERYAQYDLRAQQDVALSTVAMAWIAFATLAVTSFGVYYVARTLTATLAALEAANAANEEARRTAKAAEDTVEVTRETSRAQLRAYIAVDTDRTAVDFGDPGPRFEFNVALKNCGQTPAYNVRIAGESASGAPQSILGRPNPLPTEDSAGDSVGPGQVRFSIHRNPLDVTSDLIQSLQEGRHEIWVHGTVLYEDAFGEGHKTEFRLRLVPRSTIGRYALVPEEDGNQAN
jgi:hypothetical protein